MNSSPPQIIKHIWQGRRTSRPSFLAGTGINSQAATFVVKTTIRSICLESVANSHGADWEAALHNEMDVSMQGAIMNYLTMFSAQNLALLSDWLADTGELYVDVYVPHSGGGG